MGPNRSTFWPSSSAHSLREQVFCSEHLLGESSDVLTPAYSTSNIWQLSHRIRRKLLRFWASDGGLSLFFLRTSARCVTGVDFPVEYGTRRPGDPAILFANADKIRRELGWSARYVEIDAIVATAWRWFEEASGRI